MGGAVRLRRGLGAVRWLKKVTIDLVRAVVAAAMLAIGAALVAGLIGT